MCTRIAAGAVLSLCTLFAGELYAAASLETFVMATTGQSNYGTYGSAQPSSYIFGNFGTGLPGNATTDPSTLASYNIGGTWRVNTATGTAPISDSLSASGSGLSTFGSWTYSGSTHATAQPGQLKSSSSATHNGNADNATVNSAQSYAKFVDALTPTSAGVASGTAGVMRLAMTIDGNFAINGKGAAGMIFRYDYGDPRPGYPAINRTLLESFIDIYGNGYQLYGPHSYLGSFQTPPGFNVTIGPSDASGSPAYASFGGSSTVYADIPITFGSSTEFRMGLFTWINIGNGSGTQNSDFGNTATLTGIQLFTGSGTEITDFSLASASGAQYTADGIVLVPEPATLMLATGALLMLLLRRSR